MKQQTFISQPANCLTPWDTQQERIFIPGSIAPTLAGADGGGGRNPGGLVLCLNDQGGQMMNVSKGITGTLRAEMHAHVPILFDNHALDSRYTGPHDVAPTMSSSYGTGGNNIPIVANPTEETYCIAGNIIDREVQNGGNGFGYQPEISYTLNTIDRHAVLDTAGLDCRSRRENGNLCGTLQAGNNSLNKIHPVRVGNLLRRLTPLECERLMGFEDGWTAIPRASDSARYRALGNSVAIPCVDFVMRGMAYFCSPKKIKNKRS
jgi:DNA (cytosine-5)-methyltransferase 1